MNKAFIILFEKDLTTLNARNNLHDALTKDKSVIAWWHYITNCYIIITNNGVNAADVRGYVNSRLSNVSLFVLQIKYNNYDGFLKKDAWDWIENNLK